jgi:ElaB/YqjD/DUF883 family membrane-anchored ribosome-binding protein
MAGGPTDLGSASSDGEQRTAQQAVSQAHDQIQQRAGAVRGRAGETMRREVDRRSSDLGDHADSVARALHRSAEQLEQEDKRAAASAAHQAAEGVERAGRYLREADSDRILGDVEGFARGRPWLAGGLAAAIGFVAARFLRASSEGRYASARKLDVDADAPLLRERQSAPELPVEAGHARSD